MLSKRWQHSLLWICSFLSVMTVGRIEELFSLVGSCDVFFFFLADMD